RRLGRLLQVPRGHEPEEALPWSQGRRVPERLNKNCSSHLARSLLHPFPAYRCTNNGGHPSCVALFSLL
uniref:Uncharacterized protein n=1 Tax=Aegilops tauschii subsp. strangulata TaxID=200361 RepID=A0A453IR88_AEGTS